MCTINIDILHNGNLKVMTHYTNELFNLDFSVIKGCFMSMLQFPNVSITQYKG